MSSEPLSFHESNLWSTPIRDLGLTIEGTRLEPILAEFEEELLPSPTPRSIARSLSAGVTSGTCPVGMTPGLDWRAEYGAWPIAAAKLAYANRAIAALRERDPQVTNTNLEEDVGDIEYSLDHYWTRPSWR